MPLAFVLPWWWRKNRKPSGDWERVCDPHLLRWLSHHDGTAEKRTRGHWIAGLALFVLIEKLSARGVWFSRVTGAGFFFAGTVMLVL